MRRTPWLVIVAGLVLAGVLAGRPAPPVEAAEPPLFVKGQSYIVAVDCIPLWAAQGLASVMGLAQANPCFVEAPLSVLAVRKDGWLEVIDGNSGQRWVVNTARIYAAQPIAGVQRASR